MDLKEIKQHWKNWAEEFKLDLRATTKTPTIKKLEIAAFLQAIKKTPYFSQQGIDVLEVGCGNGHNCFSLSELIPQFSFTGVDYIPEMIVNAKRIQQTKPVYEPLRFYEGNILALTENQNLKENYHIVFTNRCLINLNNDRLQFDALDQLSEKTCTGGYIICIENIKQSYSRQNSLRTSVGLTERTPDKFNCFIDEELFIAHSSKKLDLLYAESFASLHDIILYVLVPMINDGQVDYEHPMVTAATTLLLSNPAEISYSFGDFGQNRLFVFQKR